VIVDGIINSVHVSATGNISAVGNVNATKDVYVANVVITTHVSAKGNISAVGNVNANFVHTVHVAATGNISAAGNVNAQNMNVTGDIKLAGGQDLAEDFGVVGALPAEPGSVVVLAGDDRIRVSEEPYDHRVAGVVSGAGSYRAALVLDRQAGGDRHPLALTGKVWCNVEAESGPIGLGDLLTTSSTPGHAMRVADPSRAFGAVIGKALGSLESGRGQLPILVALQ
jgi:hypothetical protein